MVQELLENNDTLSKYTHISPAVFTHEAQGNSVAINLFNSLWKFFKTIVETREKLCNYFEQKIYDVIHDELALGYFEILENLATHTSVDGGEIETVDLISIDDKYLKFRVDGVAYVNLQYGSNSDLRRGDGYEYQESFPFSSIAYAKIAMLDELTCEGIEIDIDEEGRYNSYLDAMQTVDDTSEDPNIDN